MHASIHDLDGIGCEFWSWDLFLSQVGNEVMHALSRALADV